MAISIDSSSGSKQSAQWQESITMPLTVGNGTNRLLVVAFSFWQGTASINTLTYGGTSLQAITGFINSYAPHMYVYMMKNPPVGTANIIASVHSGEGMESAVLGAASFFGVDQTTPTGSMSGTVGNGTLTRIKLSSVNTNELCLAMVGGAYGNYTPFTVSAGQTSFMAGAFDPTGEFSLSASYKSATGTTVTVSYTPAAEFLFTALSLKPSAGVTYDAIFMAGD